MRQVASTRFPQSRGELHAWIHQHLKLPRNRVSTLLAAVDAVFTRHKELHEESTETAVRALCADVADKLARVQVELSAKEATDTDLFGYFEQLVADLTDRSHRDPKTNLMTFPAFNDQLESILAFEQRGRWCALGLADVRGFKQYNDTFGPAVGDLIIERVARLLREHARGGDTITNISGAGAQEFHGYFGDEFCFLIPCLQDDDQAYSIGERLRDAVARDDWSAQDHRLAAHPILIDVGLVCLSVGRVAERRFIARRLAADLFQRVDKLMYDAKVERMSRIHFERVGIQDGTLVSFTDLSQLDAESSS